MTDHQTALIEKLAGAKIEATFNRNFLNCKAVVKSGPKTKLQKFSFVFDSAQECQGSRLLWKTCKGAYSEAIAADAAKIIMAHSNRSAE